MSRTIVFTPDVKRLADFYQMCFGLEPIGEADETWTELNAGGCNIAFHKIDEHSEIRDGWIKLVFGSGNVDNDKLRLEGLGAEMSAVVKFGDIELCDGRDPDGNWFQISSRGMQ
ncbi:MAG: VOC family protein [Pyrinomonadaceae bacterium]